MRGISWFCDSENEHIVIESKGDD